MIELSFTKLLLVAVIALLVLGPEKLPKAARMAGAMLRRARQGWDSVRSEVERELELEEIRRAAKEATDQADSLRRAADEAAGAVTASANAMRTKVLTAQDAPSPAALDTAADPASVGELPAPSDASAEPVAPEPVNEVARHGEV